MTMPFCVRSLDTTRSTSIGGGTLSAGPCRIRPEAGQGARKLKSYMLVGGDTEMKPSVSGRRISSCMPIQAPKSKPATQHCEAVGVVPRQPVERRGRVAQLAHARVELPLAAAHAAEIEPEGGEAALHEQVEEL